MTTVQTELSAIRPPVDNARLELSTVDHSSLSYQPVAHNVLRVSDSGELIVVADYAATGRPAASFHDLVPRLTAQHNIWETGIVPAGQETGMSGYDQADRWLNDIRDSGLKVRALLGFCGGSVYAGIMADRIAEWQDRPKLVLFDPGFAERQMLVDHIARFYQRLQKSFSPEELAEAQAVLQEADESSPDPLVLAAKLAGIAREIVYPAIVKSGWSDDAGNTLSRVIAGYLVWLAGAVHLDPRAAWSLATACNSNSEGIGLNGIPADEHSTLIGAAHFFDVPHAELLRTQDVADTVNAIINA